MHSQPSNPPTSKREEPASTRERILSAAHRVCADRGLHAATTREIAEMAQVNEVTLFRHFGNKENLVAELLARSVAAQSEALSIEHSDSNNLREDLLHYAQRFDQMLFEHESLIRALIGEAHRQPERAQQVIYDAVRPLRQRLIDYTRARQQSGIARNDFTVEPAIDALTGMLLAGMLRRTCGNKSFEYTHEEYVTTAVDLFARAIEGPKSARRSRKP